MKIQSLIKEGSKYLENNNISSHTLDSEILMSKILKKNREYLILNPNYKLNMIQFKNFKKLLYDRSIGKPIAYILGKKDFWNYEFEISKGIDAVKELFSALKNII